MNDISNSTSAAAIAAATSAPAPAPAAAPVAAPVSPSAAAPSVAESPASVAHTPAQDTPAAPSSAEARPAQEFQPSIFEEGSEPPPPAAQENPAEPAKPEVAPAEKDVAPAEPAAPIVYEFAYPEGFSSEGLDQERLNEFTSTLNTVKAPPEQAQKFMDMHLQEVQRAQIRTLDDVWQKYHRQQTEWKTEIKNHPELGGDNLGQTKREANAFIEQYGGSPDEQTQLRRELQQTGMGNSPRLVAAMKRAGIALSREGTPVIAPPPRSVPISKGQRGLARYAGTGTPGSS